MQVVTATILSLLPLHIMVVKLNMKGCYCYLIVIATPTYYGCYCYLIVIATPTYYGC